jgi:hypothetical protein
MDDPAEWRELGARFSELAESLHMTYALCYPPSTNIPWSLERIYGPTNRRSFWSLAERGAVLRGQPPGPNAMYYWLDLLKDGPYYKIISHSTEQSGMVDHVFAASAELCYKFETLALARERAKLMPMPHDSPPKESDATPPIEPTTQPEDPKPREDRAALISAFKAKARRQGIKVTDEMVAKAANPGKWHERSMVAPASSKARLAEVRLHRTKQSGSTSHFGTTGQRCPNRGTFRDAKIELVFCRSRANR